MVSDAGNAQNDESTMRSPDQDQDIRTLATGDLTAGVWRSFRFTAVIEPLVVGAVYLAIGSFLDETSLLIWLTAFGIFFTLRAGLVVMWSLQPAEAQRTEIWRRLFTVDTVFTASCWGFAGAMFLTQLGPLYQGFLLAVICGIAGGTAAQNSPDRVTIVLAQLLILLPAAIVSLGQAQTAFLVIGGLILFYLVYLTGVGLQTYRTAWDAAVSRHEKAALAKRLQNALLQAEKASKSKSTFLANMSHELRTPLNSILGFSELMKDRHIASSEPRKDLEQYTEYAALIHGSGSHLLALINDVLDTAKAESGKLDLNESEFDLTRVAIECLESMSPVFQSQSVDVQWLGRQPPPLHIRADERMLRQVVLNLISNAVKFTEPGGKVHIDIRERDEGLELTVTDTGIGMTPQELSGVMEPFEQASQSWARDHGGTGLGLPLTRKFVELHGGALSITSKPQAGTSVVVTLPDSRLLPPEKEPVAAPASQVA